MHSLFCYLNCSMRQCTSKGSCTFLYLIWLILLNVFKCPLVVHVSTSNTSALSIFSVPVTPQYNAIKPPLTLLFSKDSILSFSSLSRYTNPAKLEIILVATLYALYFPDLDGAVSSHDGSGCWRGDVLKCPKNFSAPWELCSVRCSLPKPEFIQYVKGCVQSCTALLCCLQSTSKCTSMDCNCWSQT